MGEIILYATLLESTYSVWVLEIYLTCRYSRGRIWKEMKVKDSYVINL